MSELLSRQPPQCIRPRYFMDLSDRIRQYAMLATDEASLFCKSLSNPYDKRRTVVPLTYAPPPRCPSDASICYSTLTPRLCSTVQDTAARTHEVSTLIQFSSAFSPRHNLTFGSRAFRFYAPRVCNSLPVSICQSQSLPTLRRHLKTFYSQSAYPLLAAHLA